MRRLVTFLAIGALLNLTACSLASPPNQSINVVPSHERAEVYVDGNLVGRGPQVVSMKKSNDHSVMAKCGSSAGMGVVERHISTTGMLDLVGGVLLLVPFLGLLSPGAFELSPKTVSVAIPDDRGCASKS